MYEAKCDAPFYCISAGIPAKEKELKNTNMKNTRIVWVRNIELPNLGINAFLTAADYVD